MIQSRGIQCGGWVKTTIYYDTLVGTGLPHCPYWVGWGGGGTGLGWDREREQERRSEGARELELGPRGALGSFEGCAVLLATTLIRASEGSSTFTWGWRARHHRTTH